MCVLCTVYLCVIVGTVVFIPRRRDNIIISHPATTEQMTSRHSHTPYCVFVLRPRRRARGKKSEKTSKNHIDPLSRHTSFNPHSRSAVYSIIFVCFVSYLIICTIYAYRDARVHNMLLFSLLLLYYGFPRDF